MADNQADTYGGDKPDDQSDEGRRLIVAMSLLTRAIQPLPQAVIENTKAYALKPDEPAAAPSPAGPQKRKKGKGGTPDVTATDDDGRAGVREAVKALLRNEGPARPVRPPGAAAPPPRGPGLGAAAVEKSFASLAGMTLRMLGPLAMVSNLLNSSASGFQTLNKAIQLLTMVFAPVLLPVTLLLSVAMIALAEILFGEGLPVMKMLFGLMKYGLVYIQGWLTQWQLMIGAVKVMIGLFEKLAAWARKIAGGDKEEEPKSGREVGFLTPGKESDPTFNAPGTDTPEQKQRDRARDLQDKVDRALNSGTLSPEDEQRLKALERGFYQNYEGGVDSARHKLLNPNEEAPKFKPGTGGGETIQIVPERGSDIGPDGRPREGARGMPGGPALPEFKAPEQGRGPGRGPNLKGILGEVIESFRLSVGPKASLTDLAAPRSQAQLAVFGDPLEKRMLDQIMKIFDLLSAEFGKIDGPPDPFKPQGP